MPLTPADLVILSRLLDEGLELKAAEVEPWLAKLPTEHRHLRDRLSDILAARTAASDPAYLSDGPRLGEQRDESVAQPGDCVGPYRLLREIGRGGMGDVWLAERADSSLKRNVALKLPRLAWGTGLAERMARERDIGALLEHPNIARLYDAGLDERGRPFLALEYVDGVSVDQWCKDKALSIPDRLRLFLQIARAVSYAHGRLVVHRDLKPSNVLVTGDGQAHLLDFGIAKLLDDTSAANDLTREQGRVLTVAYASPEQMRGETITVQSDVYSLGVLLYELLTGSTPYQPKRRTLAALEEAILEGEPPLASNRAQTPVAKRALRGEVDSILAKALRSNPADRYATADALVLDIERHLSGERVLAQPDSLGYRVNKTLRRHRFAFAASAAVILAIAFSGAWTVVQAQRVSRAAERQRLVTDFVADVFRINYRPDVRVGTPANLTGDGLLSAGAQLIDQRFPGEPALQADLYGVVGRLFLDMGAAEQAVAYATRQVEVLQLAPSDDAQAVALTTLSLALSERGRFSDAILRARKAIELSQANLLLRADATAALARALERRGFNPEATAAINQLEAITKRIGKETAAEAWMYGLRASMLSWANRYPESQSDFERGLAIASRVEGELSQTAVALKMLRAEHMFAHGEAAAAKTLADSAVKTLQLRGGPSAIAAAARSAWYAAFTEPFGLITYAEARETIERSRAFLEAQSSVPEYIRQDVEFNRGRLELYEGNIAGALARMAPLFEPLMKSNDSPGPQIQWIYAMAAAYSGSGNHEEAERLLKEGERLMKETGLQAHPYAASWYVLRSRNLSMGAQYETALRVLSSAPRFGVVGNDSPYSSQAIQRIKVAEARVLADMGDVEGAWKLANSLGLTQSTSWTNRALLAQLYCARGQPRSGRDLLQLAMDPEGRYQYPVDPWTGWLNGHAGICAWADGDRVAARQFAAQARVVFDGQPAVSPYFKRPLLKLESLIR